MPIEFYINPDRPDIFRWTFTGMWTLQDYYQTNDKANKLMFDRMPHPTCVIVDMRESGIPSGNPFSLLSHTNAHGSDNWMRTVIVTKSAAIRRFIRIARQVDRGVENRFRVVSTMQEAQQMVDECLSG